MEIIENERGCYIIKEEGQEEYVLDPKELVFCSIQLYEFIFIEDELSKKKFKKYTLFFTLQYLSNTQVVRITSSNNAINYLNVLDINIITFIENLYHYYMAQPIKKDIVLKKDFTYINQEINNFIYWCGLAKDANEETQHALTSVLVGEVQENQSCSGFILLGANEDFSKTKSIIGYAEPLITQPIALFHLHSFVSPTAYHQIYILNHYGAYQGRVLMNKQISKNLYECGIVFEQTLNNTAYKNLIADLPDDLTHEWVDTHFEYKKEIKRSNSFMNIL